jgi:hypothetical protein
MAELQAFPGYVRIVEQQGQAKSSCALGIELAF